MILFSLRICFADPDGLRIDDRANWIGKVLVFPRAMLPKLMARPKWVWTCATP